MILRTVILFTTMVFSSFTYTDGNDTFSLTVEANESRNSEGVIQFALYNKDKTIPDEHYTKYYKLKTAKITNGKATVTFEGLPAGTYAVNVLHDENENGKVDKGFMVPKEGLGFSNFESLGFSNRPNYSKAKFELSADTTITVKIIYM